MFFESEQKKGHGCGPSSELDEWSDVLSLDYLVVGCGL
jgi:hypothetical protein